MSATVSLVPRAVTTPRLVIIRVGPWPMPMTDQQRRQMDRLIARARATRLPFLSIVDDQRRECVAFVVESLPETCTVARSATGGPA